MDPMRKGKVAVMVVGHREYWPQFPELRGRLLKNAEGFESLLESNRGSRLSSSQLTTARRCAIHLRYRIRRACISRHRTSIWSSFF